MSPILLSCLRDAAFISDIFLTFAMMTRRLAVVLEAVRPLAPIIIHLLDPFGVPSFNEVELP